MTSCDDGYAKYVAPQLVSIAKNLAGYDVEFYLFHSRVSAGNIALLRDFARGLGLGFIEIAVTDAAPYEELAKHGGRWPGEAYYSLLAHELLPAEADRILYIDAGDMIIEGDIAEYYFADFEGRSLLGMCGSFLPDRSAPGADFMEKLGEKAWEIIRDQGYFNSGSYVLNLDRLRAENVNMERYLRAREQCRERFPDESKKAYYGDQGLLSYVFLGDIKFFGYPESADNWNMPYNFMLSYYLEHDYEPPYEPKIVHLLSGIFKPWDVRPPEGWLEGFPFPADVKRSKRFLVRPRHLPWIEKWWRYCEETPVYDELIAKARIYGEALDKFVLPAYRELHAMIKLFDSQEAALERAKELINAMAAAGVLKGFKKI
ncbi:MAG: hypothetical protein LBU36_05790 [Clostridiales bacterium]|jgi:lipopolysaccharide biosynthesis glycosyltransferase|nr:hypothetical protein [Clostridiales bacterium]